MPSARHAGTRTKGPSLARQMSTASASQAAVELPHDPVRLRLVKACALLLMGSAAWRVAPGVASHGLGHTLLLMDANEPFMIRAGLSRLEWLLALEGVHAAAIDRGVVTKLLDLLRRPDLDQGVADKTVTVLLKLAERQENRVALVEAGVPAGVEAFLAAHGAAAGPGSLPVGVIQKAKDVLVELLEPLDAGTA